MKKSILIPLLSVLVVSGGHALSQILGDNELHAIYIQKNQYTGSSLREPYIDGNFTNVNITGDSAPQNEPSVCISRTNPDIVVAAWRDFRLGYLEPDVVRRIGYSYSADGGVTWSESQLLPDPEPDHISQSDPVVVCDYDGNFYISSTSRQPVPNYNRQMLLYKSTDNGQTFFLHEVAVPGSGFNGEDKEWIFIDPVPTNPTYNKMMIVWKSFGESYGIKFRKSGEGGSNWGPTIDVGDTYAGQGANVTAGIDGRIIVVWHEDGIRYDISYDGGSTFGTDRYITTYSSNNNDSWPFICTDVSGGQYHGNIYVVWADRRSGSDDIWFQRSEDGGETWLGQPIRVNAATTYNQFWPVIRCDENGRLLVIYYDESADPGNINTFLAFSDDGGNTWTNWKLSDISFNGNAPNTNVRFGDYIHIDSYGGRIIPVWTDDRAGNYDQEIYTAVVDIVTSAEEIKTENAAMRVSAYPNPSTMDSKVEIFLQQNNHVRVVLCNSQGVEVSELANTSMGPGQHFIEMPASLSSGIYYVRVTAGLHNKTIKVVLY